MIETDVLHKYFYFFANKSKLLQLKLMLVTTDQVKLHLSVQFWNEVYNTN